MASATTPGAIVSIGEAMVEFNQVRPDDNVFMQGFGGDTSNCLIAAARQGASVRYVSRVGRDAFGDMLRALWQREGVDTTHVATDEHAPTGVYFVTHSGGAHQFSYLRAGSAASRLTPEAITPAVLEGARFLHVSGITQAISATACDASFHAMALARERGVAIAYDPNLRLKLWPLARARAIVRASIEQADLVLISADDAGALTGVSDPESMRDALLGWGARTLLLKLGADGVMLHAEGRSHAIAGHRVAAVDATGAGDCFAGALLARLAAGDELHAAARYANAAAALSTLGFGAIAPIPRAEDVQRLMD
jgi:2-dehydro-3-deoxygluconokinase